MKAAELCAGYNGLGLAVEEVFGATPAWFSEFEAAPSKILAHHYPGVPNHGDMTKIDWAAVEPVDIISGGTPCQDLSGAGKRKGMTEGTRSNLWVQMREAVATIRPTYVIWENVRGAYSAEASSDLEHCPGCMGASTDRGTVLRALGRVLGDLSDLGYDCQFRGLRAADVGAPHGRFRVFVLAAHPDRDGGERRGANLNLVGEAGASETHRGERERDGRAPDDSGLADSRIRNSTLTDSEGERRGLRYTDDEREASGDEHLPVGQAPSVAGAPRASEVAWGEYGPAIHRWEAVLGRRAPAPTELGKNGKHRLSPRFTEWMMGVPDGWICDVPGISRNDALKAAGNGVVPQQAAAALNDMLRSIHGKELREMSEPLSAQNQRVA